MMNFMKAIGVIALLFAAQSQASVIFGCSGYLKDVYAIGNNSYEVRYDRYSDGGFDLEPVIIYPEHVHLLGPVLNAIRDSKLNQTKYTLVVENRHGGNTKCHDGESNNALLSIHVSKYQ